MPMIPEEIWLSKEQEEKVPLALRKPLSSNRPVLHIKVGPKVKRLSKFEHWMVGGVCKTFNLVLFNRCGKKNRIIIKALL